MLTALVEVYGCRSTGRVRAVPDREVAVAARGLHLLPQEPTSARTETVVLLLPGHGRLSS